MFNSVAMLIVAGSGGAGAAFYMGNGNASGQLGKYSGGSVSTVYSPVDSSARKPAKDLSGNILIPTYNGSQVLRVSAAGSLLNTYSLPTSTSPCRLAVDSTGAIYVVCPGSVVKIAAGGTITDPWVSNGNFNTSSYILIDGSDNIFVGGGSSIYKYNTSGTLQATYTVGSDPRGMVFDASGNLYVVNNSSGTISKITSGGTVSTFCTFSQTGQTELSIDSSGNLYAQRFGNPGGIDKCTSGGTATTTWVSTTFTNTLTTDGTDLYMTSVSPAALQKVTSAGVLSTVTSLTSAPSASALAYL